MDRVFQYRRSNNLRLQGKTIARESRNNNVDPHITNEGNEAHLLLMETLIKSMLEIRILHGY